jgi:antitoxin (DNA-binding transcriptional repressor) of toxin-antitoxin stability system
MYTIVQNRRTPETPLKQVTFTEFRRNAAALFNYVERGETVRILRHGKPIAEIMPLPAPRVALSWKRPGPEIAPDGPSNLSLSREILRERRGPAKRQRS